MEKKTNKELEKAIKLQRKIAKDKFKKPDPIEINLKTIVGLMELIKPMVESSLAIPNKIVPGYPHRSVLKQPKAETGGFVTTEPKTLSDHIGSEHEGFRGILEVTVVEKCFDDIKEIIANEIKIAERYDTEIARTVKMLFMSLSSMIDKRIGSKLNSN